MQDRIKKAFDEIHAEDSLKLRTKALVYERTNKKNINRKTHSRSFATAVTCIIAVILVLGGYFSYTIPVAAISVDINPSMELDVNVYERVINITGYNESGTELAEKIDVINMDYSDAINSILNNETVISYLKTDNIMEVTVTSFNKNTGERMCKCLEEETGISKNSIFTSCDWEDIDEAHSLGLSFGKYRAFVQLQNVNPDITVEDVKSLSMKEIREMINDHESGNNGSGNQNGSYQSGGNGEKNHNGHENGGRNKT